MNVGDLVRAMESIAPPRLAAAWDNVGLLVGDASAPLARVLLTVDCTPSVAEEAYGSRCEAIVAYHPVLFEGQKSFVSGTMAYELARAGVAIYSPHTALDAAAGGTNDVLADALEMTERRPLRPAVSEPAVGFGRVGAVAEQPVRRFVDRVKAALGVVQVLVAGPLDRPVSRAAVCAGSGAEFLGDAVGMGVHLFLTGELRHHDALRAIASGVTVVCTLHSVSERRAMASLERMLSERLGGVAVRCSAADREPFTFV
ncbi:MAG TPA: Nif3-like dinuclear metal center hexameric protein [Polyangiaceae bacterium]|nr:Nif3-like dinuclear metal center hexameric protein [Polyangiaceae bacterium]